VPRKRLLIEGEHQPLGSYIFSLLLVVGATLMGVLARPALTLPDVVMIYILIIMFASARFGHGPSIAATGVSVLAYYFVFSPPVHAITHLLTCLLMLLMGLITGNLVFNLRREERESRARATWATGLFSLSRDLGSAVSQDEVAGVATRHATEVFGAESGILVPVDGVPESGLRFIPSSRKPEFSAEELSIAAKCLGRSNGIEPTGEDVSEWRFFPLVAGQHPVGVFALARPGISGLAIEKRRHVVNFLRLIALALERVALVEEAESASVRARTEEMRSSLLSAVSHDLRTPLAAITGAATALRERPEGMTEPDRRELLETICEEADHLERLVANLLDITRLEAGAVPLKREWVPLEELIGSALYRMEPRLRGRTVHIDVPVTMPLLFTDPVLLGQVFYNLFDNATKYSGEGTPIDVEARQENAMLVVSVADRGPGIPPGFERRIFEKFFRGSHTGVQGAGLGLAICLAIVEAHGGTIQAMNRSEGGAEFRVTLPFGEAPPEVPEESQE
jgi:two-component system, OmpR family, sensor histidine kinase KdpD